jgi:hypothetical protein
LADVIRFEDETPDGVPCRHCGKPIFWDEICWIHDTGFADCGLVVSGGKEYSVNDLSLLTDPDLAVQGPHAGKRAEPVGDWK